MILVLGVGNELRGDDAFGPLVIQSLREEIPEGKAMLWFGESPENFIGSIKERPDKLIILDTAQMDREPGTVELVDPAAIVSQPSTHKLPLSLLIDQLRPGETIFIAAQPKETGFNSEPSREILKAVKKAEKMILSIIQ